MRHIIKTQYADNAFLLPCFHSIDGATSCIERISSSQVPRYVRSPRLKDISGNVSSLFLFIRYHNNFIINATIVRTINHIEDQKSYAHISFIRFFEVDQMIAELCKIVGENYDLSPLTFLPSFLLFWMPIISYCSFLL